MLQKCQTGSEVVVTFVAVQQKNPNVFCVTLADFAVKTAILSAYWTSFHQEKSHPEIRTQELK